MHTAKEHSGGSEAGFTLVEILVSMVLLGGIFSAAFGSYFLGMRMVEDAREQVRASQIIQSELEAMRTMNWDDLDSLPVSGTITPQGQFIQKYANKYTTYRWCDDISGTEMKQVLIWVWWTNSRGERTYQLFNTVFTRYGLNDYYYRDI